MCLYVMEGEGELGGSQCTGLRSKIQGKAGNGGLVGCAHSGDTV